MAANYSQFTHRPDCHCVTIIGNLAEANLELEVCSCVGITTTTQAIVLLDRLSLKFVPEMNFDANKVRLTTEGTSGTQSMRELLPDTDLRDCMPQGGILRFDFMSR